LQEPAKVIGVFGLHVRTSEDEIREIFERFGPIERITMIHDVKTRSFRGYCFIYYTSLRDAAEAAQATNGLEVRDKRIRVDFSYTQRPHTPTPGFYRGHRGRNRSFERHPPRRYRSRSGDRSQREFRNHRDRDRDRDYERRRSPDRSHYRSPNRRNRSPMRERRRERDRS
jgi:transformer-2 protein